MQLHPTDLSDYVQLIYADKTDAERQQKLQHIRNNLQRRSAWLMSSRLPRAAPPALLQHSVCPGTPSVSRLGGATRFGAILRSTFATAAVSRRDWALTRVTKDQGGTLLGCLQLHSVGGDHWSLTRLYKSTQHPPNHQSTQALLNEAIEEATRRGATTVTLRLSRQRLDAKYQDLLQEAGFERVGGRLEYKLPIKDLPTEEGSPLTWKTMDELGLDATAAIFGQAASGAPDWDDDEDDPVELIGVYRTEPGLTQSASCFQVGFKDQQPVAFVAAQTEPATGWSRITYMGIHPWSGKLIHP